MMQTISDAVEVVTVSDVLGGLFMFALMVGVYVLLTKLDD